VLTPSRKQRYALCHVSASCYLHDVATESVRAVSGDEDRGFGFVFGSRRTATWSPVTDIDSSFSRLVAGGFYVFIVMLISFLIRTLSRRIIGCQV
jgi:hypothetical protein